MINKQITIARLIACIMLILFGMGISSANAKGNDWLDCPALNDEKSYTKESLKFLAPGAENWIFISKKDFIPSYKLRQSAIIAYQDFKNALLEKGTELVLVVIPPRGLVHDEKIDFTHELAKDYDINSARDDFKNVLQQLERSSIAVALAPDFDLIDEYGHATDHHFNYAGASIMSEQTAEVIKTLPVYQEIEKKDFKSETGENVTFNGTFYRPIKEICGHKLTPQTITEKITISTNEDLFESVTPEIVLVGTSFSVPGSSKSNFVGQLREMISADIDNRSIGGGGVKKSLSTYLSSDDFKEKPPKILIWEVPGFYHLNREKFLKDAVKMINESP